MCSRTGAFTLIAWAEQNCHKPLHFKMVQGALFITYKGKNVYHNISTLVEWKTCTRRYFP